MPGHSLRSPSTKGGRRREEEGEREGKKKGEGGRERRRERREKQGEGGRERRREREGERGRERRRERRERGREREGGCQSLKQHTVHYTNTDLLLRTCRIKPTVMCVVWEYV